MPLSHSSFTIWENKIDWNETSAAAAFEEDDDVNYQDLEGGCNGWPWSKMSRADTDDECKDLIIEEVASSMEELVTKDEASDEESDDSDEGEDTEEEEGNDNPNSSGDTTFSESFGMLGLMIAMVSMMMI